MNQMMSFLAGGFGIVFLIIYLLANSIFTAWLASKKGYSSGLWFVLGLFFGFFAFLTIGFAPDETTQEIASILDNIRRSINDTNKVQAVSSSTDSQKAPIVNFNTDYWICRKCGTRNILASSSCKDCGEYK